MSCGRGWDDSHLGDAFGLQLGRVRAQEPRARRDGVRGVCINIPFVLIFFFFASVYAQVSLGKNSSSAGEYLLYFFIGFVIAAQVGGRILDRRGARPAVVWGSAIAAVGFYLLPGKLTDLSLGAQTLDIPPPGGSRERSPRPPPPATPGPGRHGRAASCTTSSWDSPIPRRPSSTAWPRSWP